MYNIEIFEGNSDEYDFWFEKNKFIFLSELKAVKNLVPEAAVGLEVGVGTGRFASQLGVQLGVEPASAMAEIARNRGIEVVNSTADSLPFQDNRFDFVLFIVTICFVPDPVQAVKEIKRVLKPGGKIIIGIIDKDSFLGKIYEEKKKENKFYKHVRFFSYREIEALLKQHNYSNIQACQTIFHHPKEIKEIEPVKQGHGQGGFLAISAIKTD